MKECQPDVLLVNLPYQCCVGRMQQDDSYIRMKRIDHLGGATFRTYAGEPVGLQYVAGALRGGGWTTEILDGCLLELSIAELIDRVVDCGAPVLGLSLCSGGEHEASELLHAIDQRLSGTLVLLGGPGVRYYVVPSGLSCQVEILYGTMNVTALHQYVGAVVSPSRTIEEKIGCEERARDFAEDALRQGLSLSIRSSRGCSWSQCAYCFERDEAAALGVPNCWIPMPASEVVDSAAKLITRFDVSSITFTDTDFLGTGIDGIRRAQKIASGIRGKGIQSWMIDIRPDQVEKNVLHELQQLGLSRVFIGVESLDVATLQRYGKAIPPRGMAETVSLLEGMGIAAVPGIIVFDPLKDYDATLRDIRWLLEIDHFDLKRCLCRLATTGRRDRPFGEDCRLAALYDGLGMIYNLFYSYVSSLLPNDPVQAVNPAILAKSKEGYRVAVRCLIEMVNSLPHPEDIEARRSRFFPELSRIAKASIGGD